MKKSTKELSNHPCNSRILQHREVLTPRERGRKEDGRINIRTTTSGNTGGHIRRVTNSSRLKLMVRCLHDGNDDNYDDDEDSSPDDETHLSRNSLSRRQHEQECLDYLHVFPPSQVQKSTYSDMSLLHETHIKNLPHVL